MSQYTKNFGQQEYTISIKGKHLDITQPIRDYVEEKIKKIEKISHHIVEVNVRLELQKMDHVVDILMKFSHFKVNIRAITGNMYSAIDKSFEKLYGKLRRWKEKIQNHHAKGVSVTEIEVNVLEQAHHEIEDLDQEIIDENNQAVIQKYEIPQVSKRKTRNLKILTLSEAIMKMELSRDNFLLYRSEEENNLKVIYRRRDGSYGVMSPE